MTEPFWLTRQMVVAIHDEHLTIHGGASGLRDEGMLELILGSLDPDFLVAFDLEHPSWDGIEERLAAAGAVRVNDLEHKASFRYVRFRDPPYSDVQLQEAAARLRGMKESVFAYFRYEDEPTAPRYAERLLELLR